MKSPHSKLTLGQKQEKALKLANKLFDLVCWEDDLRESIEKHKDSGDAMQKEYNEGWCELKKALRKIRGTIYPTWY